MSDPRLRFLMNPDEFSRVNIEKHYGGGHDQKTHGNWADGQRDGLPEVANPKGERSPEANRAAAELRARIAQDEPEITRTMIDIAGSSKGRMNSLEFRLKSEKSLARKIEDDAKSKNLSVNDAANQISDVVRYTMEFNSDDYTAGVRNAISELKRAGYTIDESRIKNFWRQIDAYQGLNAKVRHPRGFEIELQFHTPESIEAKAVSHNIYEVYREAENPKQRYKLYDSMRRIARRVTAPRGALAIGVPAVLPLVIGGKEFLLKMLHQRFGRK